MKKLLRAESPQDICDILLGMKYAPNIVISDILHMVAAHVNKRSPNLFNPNGGRVTEPTEENIKLVHDNNFGKSSFPWFDRRKHVALCDVNLKETEIHLLTSVRQRYSL